MLRPRSTTCRAFELAAIVLLGAAACRAREAAPPHAKLEPSALSGVTSDAAAPRAPALTPEPAAAAPTPPSEPRPPVPTGSVELPVPEFLPAVLSWPDAEHWPAPTLVAAHGAGDSPESQCEVWRSLLGRRGVILCPRGRALRRGSEAHGFYYPNHFALESEVLAALQALEQRYSAFADVQRVVYAGYSQGAQMGLLMLVAHGKLAPSLLLIEGGSSDWTVRRAREFVASGGERVAMICGTPGCRKNAEQGVQRLVEAQVAATLRYHAGAGHTYGGPMSTDMTEAFAELTRGDERWNVRRDAP